MPTSSRPCSTASSERSASTAPTRSWSARSEGSACGRAASPAGRGQTVTAEIAHELQLDWLELAETPWGRKAYVLVGVLAHSGRIRGAFRASPTSPPHSISSCEDTTVAAAILDRLLHHCTVVSIEGESYRMRGHREKLTQLRDAIAGG